MPQRYLITSGPFKKLAASLFLIRDKHYLRPEAVLVSRPAMAPSYTKSAGSKTPPPLGIAAEVLRRIRRS